MWNAQVSRWSSVPFSAFFFAPSVYSYAVSNVTQVAMPIRASGTLGQHYRWPNAQPLLTVITYVVYHLGLADQWLDIYFKKLVL
eukprot:scaffold1946_cov397-Prasinococcus_capsulatus_cf.AAC.3